MLRHSENLPFLKKKEIMEAQCFHSMRDMFKLRSNAVKLRSNAVTLRSNVGKGTTTRAS